MKQNLSALVPSIVQRLVLCHVISPKHRRAATAVLSIAAILATVALDAYGVKIPDVVDQILILSATGLGGHALYKITPEVKEVPADVTDSDIDGMLEK